MSDRRLYIKNSHHCGRELYHHGILGQKWGVKNGPPYPLDQSDHSVRENRAGWKKSLSSSWPQETRKRPTGSKLNKAKETTKNYAAKLANKYNGLSDNQKKAIKIGAIAVGAALLTVGGIKIANSETVHSLAIIGRNDLRKVLGDGAAGVMKTVTPIDVNAAKMAHNETIAEAIKHANPYGVTPYGKHNCVISGVATSLRTEHGLNVAAKGLIGKGVDPGLVVNSCFPNAETFTGTAQAFGKSSDHAARLLIDRYGNNAAGVCGIKWIGGPKTGGHIFNWKIVNGTVEFFDGQNKMPDATVRRLFWKATDPNGYLYLARLDNAQLDLNALGRYVQVLK